jgi:hypothetical protein
MKKQVTNKHNIVLDQYKIKKKITYEIGKGKQKGQKGRVWLQTQLLCFSLAWFLRSQVILVHKCSSKIWYD